MNRRLVCRIAFFGVLAGVLAVVAVLSLLPRQAMAVVPPRGEILSPLDGAVVSSPFDVKGTQSAIPAGRHLWLAVEIGGLLWPKEPEISTAKRTWKAQVFEGGNPPGGKFSLCLVTVSPVGNKVIQKWFANGKATGDYPGLSLTAVGGSRLDRVALTLQ